MTFMRPGGGLDMAGICLWHDLRWNDHINEIEFSTRNLCTCSAKSKERAYKALVTPIAVMPILPDYPGVSRIRNESPGLRYG